MTDPSDAGHVPSSPSPADSVPPITAAGPPSQSSARDALRPTHIGNTWLGIGLWAATRIDQLGGKPDFDPATLTQRSHTEYTEVGNADLKGMLTENLVAERIVITTYQEIIRWLGDDDPTTKRLLETILAEEEEHADELNTLLG